MSRGSSALLAIDAQQKLLPLIPGHVSIVWNIRRLIDGAAILQVPVLATEQYPRGLGPTTPELAARLNCVVEKRSFSCVGSGELLAQLSGRGRLQLLLAGIETHVCVQQSALDLLAEGYQVFVAVDATGTRFGVDHETALRRMEICGVTLTTTESVLFEWCETAGSDQFKQISALVREPRPA
jgi:nicotinamidase-related amidase